MSSVPKKADKLNLSLSSNVTITSDLGHHLELEFSSSNMQFAILSEQKRSDCHEIKNEHNRLSLGFKG